MRGVAVERAAVDIGVEAADLATWIREAASDSPLFVPVHVEDEDDAVVGRGVVVVFGCGVRVEPFGRRPGGVGEAVGMIGAHGRVPVFAYRRPADLRKGFEGLSALVREALGQDPLSGALYLFTNQRRTTAKVLHFDGTGLGLYVSNRRHPS